MSLLTTERASLDIIREPISEELKKFNQIFKESMRSQVALVDLIARYIVHQKGKRVRPLLVLLSAKICGEINEHTYRAATLIEILHTATLVHDDVVDDADTRRDLHPSTPFGKTK